ncbi:amidase domain-containing protein [Clostridium saudiense]|uniref:amidase domain-containing protein n=1 Tax=Clostridium saudiense TaxID=1414720 RepID=UPI0018A8CBB9|nr:hypothetical protein [Clostridium saudiense]
MLPIDKNNKVKVRNNILMIGYYLLVIGLFAYFFFCIGKTPPSNYISQNNILSSVAASADIDSIESRNNLYTKTTTPDEEALTKFISSAFNERNNSFLNGNVSRLYNYYGTSEANGKYSLEYEFKRIAYLRDWSIERSIIFTSISSSVIINKINRNDNKIIVNLDEYYNFNYLHNKQVTSNKFSFTIPHIMTIYSYNNEDGEENFIIDKDYYSDIFNDDLNDYDFTLTETSLPYTKRINPDYNVSSSFNKDDVIRFDKSLFTDHKAIISGYDSNGYPLIDSNLFNITNMPFDLGWKEKNIKLSY